MNTTTTATQLWRMGATELAAAIRTKQVSSREVVDAHLRRIDEVNPVVNAVTVVLREQALESAEAADRTLRAGKTSVPCTVCPSRPRRTSTSPAPRRRSA